VKELILILTLVLVLCGCASPKAKGVKVGMTMAEVTKLIGKPIRKSSYKCPSYAKNCPEIWQYDGYNVSFSDNVVDAVQ